MKPRLLICALALLLLSGCVPQPAPSLYSEREVLAQLQEAYGVEFTLLASEPSGSYNPYTGSYIENGKRYTLAPVDDPSLRFEAVDAIQLSNSGPIPVIFPAKYHYFRDSLVDEYLLRHMLRFFAENGSGYETDPLCVCLPAEGWEAQIEGLAERLEQLNGEFPFSTGRPPLNRHGIQFRLDVCPGVYASDYINFYHEEIYGFNAEEAVGKLRDRWECNFVTTSLAFALCELFEENDVAYTCNLPDPDGEDGSPYIRCHVILPDEAEMERVFPLLDTFFAQLGDEYQVPGAASAGLMIDFQKSAESVSWETCRPFQREAPYVWFDTEGFRARVRRSLFPVMADDAGSELIVGDRITIDGDNLIVERGDQTVIIDRSACTGSGADNDGPDGNANIGANGDGMGTGIGSGGGAP